MIGPCESWRVLALAFGKLCLLSRSFIRAAPSERLFEPQCSYTMLTSYEVSDIIKAAELITRYWIWRPLASQMKKSRIYQLCEAFRFTE